MTKVAARIGTIDRFLLKLDDGVFGGVFRVLIGFSILPAMSLLLGNEVSEWTLIPFILAILVLVRVIPAIVRKLVPFSTEVRNVWAARRRIAKRHDSYQWRKLMWIGIGLAMYMVASGQFSPYRIVICAACLLTGATGMARWRAVSADGKHPSLSTDQARSMA
jgi:hypothetical protein